MTDAQLATAIDCEGYIGIYRAFNKARKCYNFSARISIAMVESAIIYEFSKRFGGKVYFYQTSQTNRDLNPNRRPCYHWVAQNRKQVRIVLEAILPHLLVKREQAENVLGFIEHCDNTPLVFDRKRWARVRSDREAIISHWQKSKELNRRAPATTERENPVMGCDSLSLHESVREIPEAESPALSRGSNKTDANLQLHEDEREYRGRD